MERRGLLLALLQVARPLDERGELTVWFGELAGCLTRDSAAEFRKALDRAMPDRSLVEANVTALLQVAAVASIADLREITGSGGRRVVTVDWILKIYPKQDGAPRTQRRATLRFELLRRKNGWGIAGLDNPGFFAP